MAMTTGGKVGVVLVAIIIIGGGVAWAMHARKKNDTTNTTTSSNSGTSTSDNSSAGTSSSGSSDNSTTQAAATITYSDSGFSPAQTTVKAGDTVAIKNTSSGELDFYSNPHPVHTDDSDLNVGPVAAGQTKTFTVTKTGTFGFHNHLSPTDTAKITIQ